jgi:UDP-GlcNAc:undecaprenyl-phosphate GlcNAc-1-phosphate transferase
MTWPLTYLFLFIITFLLSFLLTPLMIPLAFRLKIIDEPGARKIHKKVMPRAGGLSILLSFILPLIAASSIIFLAQRGVVEREFLPSLALVHLPGMISVLPRLFYFLLGGIAIFIIGLLDDLNNLGPAKKILGESIVIAVVVGMGIRLSIFSQFTLLTSLLTIVWMLTITNAFNLLDNMDGLSAGVALVSSLIFLVIAASNHQYFVATLLAIFLGGLTGFLPYNFHPAKIFMGDSGSLFVGYIMSGLTVLSSFYHEGLPTHLALLMPILILAVPLYDTGSVILIRLREKRSVFKGDKSHFSHRLTSMGMSERLTCLFIYLVTFALGIGATLLSRVNLGGAIIILIESISVLSIIAVLEFSARK